MPPSGYLYPNSGNQRKKVEIPAAIARISLPKQRKIGRKGREPHIHRPDISTQTVEFNRKGRDSQVPQVAYLYPNSKNQPKRVEILTAPGRISLPKQRKSAEKGRDSKCLCPEISTQTVEISRKGREPHIRRPHTSTQTAKIGRRLCFRTVIFYKSCVYMIKYTH